MEDSLIQKLFERHRRQVFDYIKIMVNDDAVADDIFQETWIKAIRFIEEGRYVDKGQSISWMLCIAHNQVIDHFRWLKKQNHFRRSWSGFDVQRNLRFPDPTVEEQMIREQTRRDVWHMIDELPDKQREVIILRYYMEFSFKDIAQLTGVCINTALARVRYALINLKKMIEEKDMR